MQSNVWFVNNDTYYIFVFSSYLYLFSVHCEYIELADHINVSTYIYPLEEKVTKDHNNFVYWKSNLQVGGVLFISQRDNNTCSQHVKTSCYFDGFDGVYYPSSEM